jgi:hypothetical protein
MGKRGEIIISAQTKAKINSDAFSIVYEAQNYSSAHII